MLRAIRFSCQLEFDIEDETYASIKRNAELLKMIPKERIREEFNKILLSKDPFWGINMLDTRKLLSFISPSIRKC